MFTGGKEDTNNDNQQQRLPLELLGLGENPLFGMSAELSDDCRYSLFRGKVRLYHARAKVPGMGRQFWSSFQKSVAETTNGFIYGKKGNRFGRCERSIDRMVYC